MKFRFSSSFLPLALLLFTACSPPALEPARNLIVICIDTLRADRLGSYGHTRDTSPIFDSLASDGALFVHALAQAPWTVPATASLMTSLLPTEHGAAMTGEIRNFGQDELPGDLREDVVTLAEAVSPAGLRSAMFSANPFLLGGFGQGFERTEVGHRGATELTDLAIDWVREVSPEPFFVYLQYIDLHAPIQPPEPYAEYFPVADQGPRQEVHARWRFGRSLDRSSPEFQSFRAHKLALYDGALRYVDSEIGRLVRTLKELEAFDNTLIVLTSDHGEEFWDHAEIQAEMGGDPRDLVGIGHGHSMFQELLRIPLAFVGPGVESRRYECPVQHLDVAPTVLGLLGLEPAPGMRGRDLSAALIAGDPRCEERPLIAQSPAYGVDSQAIVFQGKKLIERVDGRRLLFDLETDPGESRDLAASEPRNALRMAQTLEVLTAAGDEAPATEGMELDDKTRAELRALGYLE